MCRSRHALRARFLLWLFLLTCTIMTPAAPASAQLSEQVLNQDAPSGLDTALDGQHLSKDGDRLIKEGHEREAVQSYVGAHELFQKTLLRYFEQGFRSALGGMPVDEDSMMQAGTTVAGLRNVNLSKLWIVLDPDDRAFEHGVEDERASLLQRFDGFRFPASAEPLEQFLRRLYPDDALGDRQMEALRDGKLPLSKRWMRLGIDRPPGP